MIAIAIAGLVVIVALLGLGAKANAEQRIRFWRRAFRDQ